MNHDQNIDQGQTKHFQPSVQPGGFFIRFFALFIDQMIISIAIAPIQFGIAFSTLMSGDITGLNNGVNFISMALSYLLIIGLSFCYSGYFYSTRGATPGKMVFNLYVVDSETGTRLSFAKGGFRDTVGKFVSSILFLTGYFMAIFNSERKSLHDMMFGTQVIRKR